MGKGYYENSLENIEGKPGGLQTGPCDIHFNESFQMSVSFKKD